jgi:acylphosphatase
MRVARRFLVSGRVQGVGFRYFTEEAAYREGIHGWVRNLPDGRVEVVAEGERVAIDRFERAIAQGPRGARVEAVEVSDEVPSGRETGFSIR